MSLAKKLFRESALERLSSPEQLDRLLTVTNPRGWIALLAIWALLIMIIIWSIYYEIPTKEHGQGIIVSGGGLKIVDMSYAGHVKTIDVTLDQRVKVGQLVATIDKTDLSDQIDEVKAKLKELEEQHRKKLEFESDEKQARVKLADSTRQRHEQDVENSQKRIERLRKQRALRAGLVKTGDIAELKVFEVEDEIENEQSAMEQAALMIVELAAANLVADIERARKEMDREFEMQVLQDRIDNMEKRLDRESSVRSAYAGRVIEIRIAQNTTVDVGTPIILIEPEDSDSPALKAILYVSAVTGKNIKVGMEVLLNPSTVKQEEHGSMRGTVTFIAQVPTSKSAMTVTLSDRDLAERFTSEIGTPLEMHVELNIADTFSGYEWTSSQGPPMKISANTLCSGSVTVKRQSPLSLVIPILRSKLGDE